jgi:hypothetical protein
MKKQTKFEKTQFETGYRLGKAETLEEVEKLLITKLEINSMIRDIESDSLTKEDIKEIIKEMKEK